MKDKLLLIWKHLKPENLQKMWLQSKWIWQYGKRYWKSIWTAATFSEDSPV